MHCPRVVRLLQKHCHMVQCCLRQVHAAQAPTLYWRPYNLLSALKGQVQYALCTLPGPDCYMILNSLASSTAYLLSQRHGLVEPLPHNLQHKKMSTV
jgi:hypothetical protein